MPLLLASMPIFISSRISWTISSLRDASSIFSKRCRLPDAFYHGHLSHDLVYLVGLKMADKMAGLLKIGPG